MKYFYNLSLIFMLLFSSTFTAQQTFERIYEIPVPVIEN
jgi:hypothetical protein